MLYLVLALSQYNHQIGHRGITKNATSQDNNIAQDAY